jgi:hypothetical protein
LSEIEKILEKNGSSHNLTSKSNFINNDSFSALNRNPDEVISNSAINDELIEKT